MKNEYSRGSDSVSSIAVAAGEYHVAEYLLEDVSCREASVVEYSVIPAAVVLELINELVNEKFEMGRILGVVGVHEVLVVVLCLSQSVEL